MVFASFVMELKIHMPVESSCLRVAAIIQPYPACHREIIPIFYVLTMGCIAEEIYSGIVASTFDLVMISFNIVKRHPFRTACRNACSFLEGRCGGGLLTVTCGRTSEGARLLTENTTAATARDTALISEML